MPDGRLIPVEVKGSRGDSAFMITRNERRAAATPEYLLLWVFNLRNPQHLGMRRFPAIGAELNDDYLSALSWVVEDWVHLDYDEVPIRIGDTHRPKPLAEQSG